MKNRKWAAMLCAAAMLLSLAGCAAYTTPGTADPQQPQQDQSDPAGQQTPAPVVEDPYDEAEAVRLTFRDDGIDGTADGVEIDGTALTIREAGTYLLSGSCADGSVKVKKGVTGVTLVLSGLTLESADTAPLTCAKSSQVVLVAAGGTVNTLRDAARNNDDEYPDNENAENAVIKCKDGSQVTLCGGGTLVIESNGKNGIKSGMTTEDEGEAFLTIRDLTLEITTTVNDAVNAEELLSVESGTLRISAADDALHCDRVLNVGAEGTAGPVIDISACYEGIEGAELNFYSGSISITAEDDCINAANSDLADYPFAMNFYGGTINAYTSSGDGFDSNGSMTFAGATVAVWTANSADNQPLDADGTITVSGGTVLAAGASAGMGMNLSAEQPCVTFGSGSSGLIGRFFGSSSSLSKGSAFSILDANGGEVFSGTAVCAASFVFYSSPALSDGASYTLSSSSEQTGTASTGTSSTGMGGGFGGGFGGRGEGGGMPARPGDGEEMPVMPGDGEMPSFPGGEMPGDGTMPGDGEMPSFPGGEMPGDGTMPGEGETPPEKPAGGSQQ